VVDVRVESVGPEIEGPGGLSQSPKPLRLKQEILDRELDRVYEAKTLRGEAVQGLGFGVFKLRPWCRFSVTALTCAAAAAVLPAVLVNCHAVLLPN
jgi:hypothetical protein